MNIKGGIFMSSKGKEKLLLALGERQLESFIKLKMSKEFVFTKEASYREIVIKRIREERPDIVLIREALKGSMSIESLVLDIRENYPDVRVVFYTSKNRPGEPLLRRLVSYGVYDLIGGESITEAQIYDGLLNPKKLSDVRQYLDAPSIESDEPPMLVTAEYIDLEEEKEVPIELPPLNQVQRSKEDSHESTDKKDKNSGLIGRLFGRNKKESDQDPIATEKNGEKGAPKETPVTEYQNPLGIFGNTTHVEKDIKEPVYEKLEVEEEIPVEDIPSNTTFEEANVPDITFDDSWLDEEVGDEDVSEGAVFENEPASVPVVEHEPRLTPSTEPDSDDRLTIQARGKPKEKSIGKNMVDDIKLINKKEKPYNDTSIGHKKDDSAETKGWLSSKNNSSIKVKSNQIITFVSAVHGVGNTHIAFNTALKLAEEGNNILYIDMNSSFSSVDFSFQLGTWQQGIDKALEDIEYNSGMNASDNIIRMKDVKVERKEDKQLQELYKSLPDSLDYLFYSLDYQTLEKQHAVPKDRIRDLIMYLMTRERYDAVIIDSEPLGVEGVDGLLNLSNKIYFTMTQDPGQMGVFHRQFDAAKNRVKITGERYIIVNQFVDVEPKEKRIQKWTNETVLQTIPFTHKNVILANFLGEPFILKTKHKDAIEAFDKLARHLAK